MRDDLEFNIKISRPAFEKRHDNPALDYGIGSVKLLVTLTGPKGALSFEIFTGWYLPHVAERLRKETGHQISPYTDKPQRCSFEGDGGQVNWHSPVPMYEGQEMSTNCTLLPGGKCYCDVGFLAGEELFTTMVEGGEEALRAKMQEWYEEAFEAKEAA